MAYQGGVEEIDVDGDGKPEWVLLTGYPNGDLYWRDADPSRNEFSASYGQNVELLDVPGNAFFTAFSQWRYLDDSGHWHWRVETDPEMDGSGEFTEWIWTKDRPVVSGRRGTFRNDTGAFGAPVYKEEVEADFEVPRAQADWSTSVLTPTYMQCNEGMKKALSKALEDAVRLGGQCLAGTNPSLGFRFLRTMAMSTLAFSCEPLASPRPGVAPFWRTDLTA